MIYHLPAKEEPIDQGDLIEGCPLLILASFDLDNPAAAKVDHVLRRILVLTQTCDLANEKTTRVVGAVVFTAQDLVAERLLKPADIRGPLRAGRIWGWYFLPKNAELGLPERLFGKPVLGRARLPPSWVFPQFAARREPRPPAFRIASEMIVDFHYLYTFRLDLLKALCQRGQRLARVQPLYREHLAKHFADTYSRIGLPEPYETEP